MNQLYIINTVVIMTVVIWLMRALPFFIFGEKRAIPKPIEYLGKVLPYATMAMLVVYCLKDISFESSSSWLPAIISVIVVAALQVWKKDSVISVVAGTVVYMLLINFVFR